MSINIKDLDTYSTVASLDKLALIDVSDTTDSTDGTYKLATVSDLTLAVGGGDMTKSVYDTGDTGVVDEATTLSGVTATAAEVNTINTDASIVKDNDVAYQAKDSGGTGRDVINLDTGNDIVIGGGGTANDHIVLNPGNAELVKSQVLRQDITTNSYENNSVVLTGWGWILGDGATAYRGETVTFGITFSSLPIVQISSIGHLNNADPTEIDDFTGDPSTGGRRHGTQTKSIAVGSFVAQIFTTDGSVSGGTLRYGYSWIAVGQLA